MSKFLIITLLLLFIVMGLVSSRIVYKDNKYFSNDYNYLSLIREDKKDDSKEQSYLSSISIEYLRSLKINSDEPTIEEELTPSANYKRYIASYLSEENKIYGLLTVPDSEKPDDGYKAIVFIHGYIPPDQYITTERYTAYVDYLAKNGFVVFKIDLRGHGDSEGEPTGSYFSPGYTIDAISAVKSLQKLDYVNRDSIGLWGHSMAGNALLRAMLVESDIKAGVIFSGAVYSYEDFMEYRLNDSSYVRRPRNNEDESEEDQTTVQSKISQEVEKLRDKDSDIDFEDEFWKSISLTQNIEYLNSPVQLHHAENDNVVNIGYSRDLSTVLSENNKEYELYEYKGGGHNIESPYFETAMERTIKFFNENL